MPNNIITVTQLNTYLKSLLEGDRNLRDCLVKGELSNVKKHYASGHIYFTLKDKDSSIRAVMFRGNAQHLKFEPDNGLAVIIRGRVSLYERDGGLQLYVSDIQPEGMGALNLAFEQLKEKLSKEGLFESARKQAVPQYPKKIGIVTSGTGAALQDMLNIFRRRYPVIQVLLVSVLVQGDMAPPQIADGIALLNQVGCDTIITGRGGGSLEELWAFNTEAVARAIADSKIPVISAVGHETDFTIADFVADLRAPTPSAAAELATPDREQLQRQMNDRLNQLYRSVSWRIQHMRQLLDASVQSGGLSRPQRYIDEQRIFLDRSMAVFQSFIQQQLTQRKQTLSANAGVLDALSPLKVLSRGYTITSGEKGVIRSAGEVSVGDVIHIRLQDGELSAEVKDVKTNP